MNVNLLNLRRPAAGGYIQLSRNRGILHFAKWLEYDLGRSMSVRASSRLLVRHGSVPALVAVPHCIP
jgi:hypothetical protein